MYVESAVRFAPTTFPSNHSSRALCFTHDDDGEEEDGDEEWLADYKNRCRFLLCFAVRELDSPTSNYPDFRPVRCDATCVFFREKYDSEETDQKFLRVM